MKLTRPESCDNLTSIRYLWRVSPCPLKKCYIYSKENALPTPPFVLHLENNEYHPELFEDKTDQKTKVDKGNKVNSGSTFKYSLLVVIYTFFEVVDH